MPKTNLSKMGLIQTDTGLEYHPEAINSKPTKRRKKSTKATLTEKQAEMVMSSYRIIYREKHKRRQKSKLFANSTREVVVTKKTVSSFMKDLHLFVLIY